VAGQDGGRAEKVLDRRSGNGIRDRQATERSGGLVDEIRRDAAGPVARQQLLRTPRRAGHDASTERPRRQRHTRGREALERVRQRGRVTGRPGTCHPQEAARAARHPGADEHGAAGARAERRLETVGARPLSHRVEDPRARVRRADLDDDAGPQDAACPTAHPGSRAGRGQPMHGGDMEASWQRRPQRAKIELTRGRLAQRVLRAVWQPSPHDCGVGGQRAEREAVLGRSVDHHAGQTGIRGQERVSERGEGRGRVLLPRRHTLLGDDLLVHPLEGAADCRPVVAATDIVTAALAEDPGQVLVFEHGAHMRRELLVA
jgi:hypothetical protein